MKKHLAALPLTSSMADVADGSGGSLTTLRAVFLLVVAFFIASMMAAFFLSWAFVAASMIS
jgi:hypothetical protein